MFKARTIDNKMLYVKIPLTRDLEGQSFKRTEYQVYKMFASLVDKELSIRKLSDRCGLGHYHPKAWAERLVSHHCRTLMSLSALLNTIIEHAQSAIEDLNQHESLAYGSLVEPNTPKNV